MSQAECFKDLLGSTPVPLENRIEKGDLSNKDILWEMGISLVGKLDFGDHRDSSEYPINSELRLTRRFVQEPSRRVIMETEEGWKRVTAEGRVMPRRHCHSRDWEERHREGKDWDLYMPRHLKIASLTANDYLSQDLQDSDGEDGYIPVIPADIDLKMFNEAERVPTSIRLFMMQAMTQALNAYVISGLAE